MLRNRFQYDAIEWQWRRKSGFLNTVAGRDGNRIASLFNVFTHLLKKIKTKKSPVCCFRLTNLLFSRLNRCIHTNCLVFTPLVMTAVFIHLVSFINTPWCTLPFLTRKEKDNKICASYICIWLEHITRSFHVTYSYSITSTAFRSISSHERRDTSIRRRYLLHEDVRGHLHCTVQTHETNEWWKERREQKETEQGLERGNREGIGRRRGEWERERGGVKNTNNKKK